MKNFSFLSFILLAVALFAGCKKNEGGNNDRILVKATVGNAEYIYSTESGGRSRTNDEKNAFFTVDKEGKNTPIRFITNNGDTLSMSISAVHDINPSYLLIRGSFYINVDPYYYYLMLVNKATEAIYALPSNINIEGNKCMTDGAGNMYFFNYISKIYKIDVSDFTINQYLPDGQDFKEGLISTDGVLCYSSNSPRFKFKHPSGRIYPWEELSDLDNSYSHSPILNSAGEILIIERRSEWLSQRPGYDGPSEYEMNIVISQVEYNPTGLGVKRLSSDVIATDVNPWVNCFWNYVKDELMLVMSDESLYVFDGTRLEKCPNKMTSNPHRNFLYLKNVICQVNLGSLPKIIRLDLNTYQETVVDIQSSGYEIYEVTGSKSNNDINFSGLRYNDAKNVIGKINQDGTLQVLNETSSTDKITNLIKLN